MEYIYTRDLQANNEYDIGYIDAPVSLAKQIKSQFSTNHTLDYFRCHGTQVKISISPDLDSTEKTILDTLVQEHKNAFISSSKIFKITNNGRNPEQYDINLFGLHKKETIDTYGSLILIEYYKNYDGITYSDLVVTDEYIYNIGINDLVIDRTETIKWYMIDDTIGYTKIISKYYNATSAIYEGIRRRINLIEKAKVYGMTNIVGNHEVSGEPEIPNSHWFFMQISDEANLYIQGINKQGLIDVIQGSTESYLTQTIKDGLEACLKYWV